MNRQKMETNPFKQKFDHTKHKSKTDNNNNNGNNGNNATNSLMQKPSQKINPRNARPTINHPNGLKSCLKINNKSKGGKCIAQLIYFRPIGTVIYKMFHISCPRYAVQKGKSVKFKTPAQDRLQKIVKKDRTAVVELLNDMVDLKSTIKSVLPKQNFPHGCGSSQKSKASGNGNGSTKDIKPSQAVVNCAKPHETANIGWTNYFGRNDGVSKIGTTAFHAKQSLLIPSFCLPENGLQTCQSKSESNNIKKGHHVENQNRLKINDTSKIISGK